MRTVALFSTLITTAFAWSAEPKPASNDEIELAYLHESRPFQFRLHVQFDGKSYREHWQSVIDQLFRYLDFDENGRIDLRELDAAPNAEQFRLLVEGNEEIEAGPPPHASDIGDNASAGFSLDPLRAYYHRAGVGPWQARVAFRGRPPGILDDELIRSMAPKNPQVLTREELQRAWQTVMQRDHDHDEMIMQQELLPNPGLFAFVIRRPNTEREGTMASFETSAKGRQVLARKLIARYDRNKNGKLEPKECQLPEAVFAVLDRDRSQTLDEKELEAWPDQRPDLELVIRMDVPLCDQPVTLAKQTKDGLHAAATSTGSVRAQIANSEIEVLRIDATDNGPFGSRQRLLDEFQALDRNNDGVLDPREIFQPPFRYVAYLRLADRNRDHKLTRKEASEFFELQRRLYTRLTMVTLVERMNVLYELLDADHDMRLSVRELRNAWSRVQPWANLKAGQFERGRVPLQYQVILSHGPLSLPEGDPGKGSIVQARSRLRGPTWFCRMDRNGDGDISRAEFLGTVEQFRKLDRDGDGLIDADEAAAGSDQK